MIPDWFLSHSLSYLLFLIYLLLSVCPDTDHDFLNSRVIRKLEVTKTKATWSKHDWQVCKSDIPDPNVWDSDECGSAEDALSLTPTDSPTPKSQKDCEFFFTELADVENVPFITLQLRNIICCTKACKAYDTVFDFFRFG